MKAYFSTKFEDIKHERSLFLLLLIAESDLLKQNLFRDQEIYYKKNLALEKKT